MPEREGTTTEPSVHIAAGRGGPVPLPMAGRPRERADAAANRRRILDAARRLLAESGAEGLTMQAVATEAGVGKGTVFHRFGDRDGLTGALIDEYMTRFQDLVLHGPPPLGPGAPALERLEAFMVELVALQVEHLELALAAEPLAGDPLPPVYVTLLMHVSNLIGEVDPGLDAEVTAGYLLGAISAPALNRMRSRGGADVQAFQRAAARLVTGLTPGQDGPGGHTGSS
jgi:AcrR family transcriptional regulator